MSKAVLISIKPEWCTLISRKEKTIEVRKRKPKIKAPFKCYIYCTKKFVSGKGYGYKEWAGAGKIIGEFICDTIITDHTFGHDPLFYAMSGMSAVERAVYCTERNMYGWHISDLKIYDRPKELGEFNIKKPPQSWQYVEERK